MAIGTPICLDCKHFEQGATSARAGCLAFPDGIPLGIIDGELDHEHPLPGDHGIQFEPKEEAEQ